MFRNVFDPENSFFRMIAKGVDIVGLSLLWVALSLPIITIGPATAALYYVVVKTFRHKQTKPFKKFLKTFWNNLRLGIPVTLICIPVALLLMWGYDVMSNNISTSQGVIMFMAYHVLMVVPVGLICYLFPLLGRFEFKMGKLFGTSALLALRHLPSTLIVVLLVVQMIVFTLQKWWPIFFVPVVTALLTSLFLERIFAKYLSKDDIIALNEQDEEIT